MAKVTTKNTCETCGKTFSKHWRLIEHIRNHTGERPFKCFEEGCHKTFVREYHLKRHHLSHSGERPFRCKFEGCGKAFTLQHNQKRHEERAHNQPFKCDVPGCGMSFNKNSKLSRHKGMHDYGKPYRCSVSGCSSTFNTPSRLQRHLKIHQKEYKCSVEGCNTTFPTWSELTKHSVTHKPKARCEECDRIFGDQHELRNHSDVHSSTRKVFVCSEDGCSRSYTKKYSLKVHVRSFHRHERPHICQHEGCGKSFSHKVSLNNHMATHDPNKKKARKKRKRKRKSLAAKLARYKGKETADRTNCDIEDPEQPTCAPTALCEKEVSTQIFLAEELTPTTIIDTYCNALPRTTQTSEEKQLKTVPENVRDPPPRFLNSYPIGHFESATIDSTKEHNSCHLVQCSSSA